MTLNDLIQPIRLIVHDDVTQTWKDETYAIVLSDGARYIAESNPESKLTATGTLATVADFSADSPLTEMWIPEVYRTALIEYGAFRYFNSDSADTRNQTLAKEHWERFLRYLTPVGR